VGLALRLLPVDHFHGNFGNCRSLLELGDLDWDLGGTIRERARLLPDGHDISAHLATRIRDGEHEGSRCYGKLVTDVYGELYRWLTARELVPVLREHWPKHPVTAYVDALPDDRLIVLDWH
jgi:hypothetical protein